MIRIPRRVVEEMASDAASRYPEEACGLLIGRIDSGLRLVHRISPARNAYAGEKRRRYMIDPIEYKRVEDETVGMSEIIVGVYHSHPDAPAIPSDHDNSYAVPFLSYVILSVSRGRVAEITAWYLDEVVWRLQRDTFEIVD